MGRDRFNFKELLYKIKLVEKEWLKDGLEIAKKEFDNNFDTEIDKGDDEGVGGAWEPSKYNQNHPLLQLTGEMRRDTINSKSKFGNGFGFFIIDPIDKRGRPYAEYHHTGTNIMPQRRTVVQSSDLDFKQLNRLKFLMDKVFL